MSAVQKLRANLYFSSLSQHVYIYLFFLSEKEERLPMDLYFYYMLDGKPNLT